MSHPTSINAIVAGMVALGLILLAVGAPRAQSCELGAYGCGHRENHDQYKSWERERSGYGGQKMSCCNEKDCRPARVRYDSDQGLWQWWDPENRYWVTAPKIAELPKDKLGDGRAHVCAPISYKGAPAESRITYCISPSDPRI